MSTFLSLMARHGYSIISLIVFLEAIGLPVPAALALVAAGAAGASGILSAPLVLLLAVIGMLVGDSLLYVLGRHGFACPTLRASRISRTLCATVWPAVSTTRCSRFHG